MPHFSDRWTAVEVTKWVAGVRAIANDIEVKIPKPGERSDSDIASDSRKRAQMAFRPRIERHLAGRQARLDHSLRSCVLRLPEDRGRGRGALFTRREGRFQRYRSAPRGPSDGRKAEDPKRVSTPGVAGCQGHQGQCGRVGRRPSGDGAFLARKGRRDDSRVGGTRGDESREQTTGPILTVRFSTRHEGDRYDRPRGDLFAA